MWVSVLWGPFQVGHSLGLPHKTRMLVTMCLQKEEGDIHSGNIHSTFLSGLLLCIGAGLAAGISLNWSACVCLWGSAPRPTPVEGNPRVERLRGWPVLKDLQAALCLQGSSFPVTVPRFQCRPVQLYASSVLAELVSERTVS